MDENTSTSALLRLKERKDFLAAAKGRKAGSGTLSLQGRRRLGHESDKADPSSIRIGFTCSKRVGNAVARNRARRTRARTNATITRSIARGASIAPRRRRRRRRLRRTRWREDVFSSSSLGAPTAATTRAMASYDGARCVAS